MIAGWVICLPLLFASLCFPFRYTLLVIGAMCASHAHAELGKGMNDCEKKEKDAYLYSPLFCWIQRILFERGVRWRWVSWFLFATPCRLRTAHTLSYVWKGFDIWTAPGESRSFCSTYAVSVCSGRAEMTIIEGIYASLICVAGLAKFTCAPANLWARTINLASSPREA